MSGNPTEGGSGGKRGHSNMEHRVYTAEIKESTRRRRRALDREIVREDAQEYLDGVASDDEERP